MIGKWKAAGLALLLLVQANPAIAQVDLESFLKRDLIQTLKISPSGEYYAMTVPQEDRVILTIVRRSDKKLTAQLGGIKHSVIHDFWWVNDDRVVVSVAEKLGSEDQPYLTGDLHAVNADGSRITLLFGRFGLEGDQLQQQAAFMVDTLRNDDRNILVSVMTVGSNPLTRVERLDVYSRRRSVVATAPVRRARFATDAEGNVRFAQGAGPDNISKLYYRKDAQSEWQLLNDQDQTGRVEWPLGISADGATAYLQSENIAGPDSIMAMDLAKGTRTEQLRDPLVDPYSVIFQADERGPVGAFFMHDRMRTRFIDEASSTARFYRKLEKAFPDQAVAVTSSTRDGRLHVVKVWSDRNPGDYYLFDNSNNTADLVFSQRRWFQPAKMLPARAVTLKARDGLPVHAYLTLPGTVTKQKPPMVVMVHGGPYGIFDEWDFNDDAQMLGQAGYAVLRVNFRGSGNYGRAYLQAGARQWGGAMQDDVSDATRWAIEQGIADPERICIFGASYGGYAALTGVSKEPDLYRCAVGYVGVYNLTLTHKQDSRLSKSRSVWLEDWMGPRDTLAAVSPVNLATRIKVPVLLAAGGEDEIAPILHSKQMEKALRKAGVPVETLYYDSEGHGFYTEPHRREFYVRLLDFLSRHIGGASAAQGLAIEPKPN